MKKLSCMSDLWLFESLNPEEKQHIQALFRRPVYEKGEFLFLEGEPAQTIFVVVEGRVKLYKTSDDGKEIVFGFLTPHSLFGDETLFNDSIRTMSAQALERTRLCACYKTDFEALVAQNSTISMKIIRMLGDRINKMAEQLSDMAVYETQRRLARTLVRLARAHGEHIEDGYRLTFRLTHDDLGALVGASRVMVTNVLKSLKKAGVVRDDPDHRLVVSSWYLAETGLDYEEEFKVQTPKCQCFKKSLNYNSPE